MIWIYYVVVFGVQGAQNIEITRFDSIEKCEAYMHDNHRKLKKVYFKEGEQRMTGSGCRRAPTY